MSKELSSIETSSAGDTHCQLLSESEISFKERYKECFKPSCHVRRVNNKGAILVIIWSYLALSVFHGARHVAQYYCNTTTYLTIMAVIGLTLPIAGWSADVRFGRYKVLSCSLWIMWISSILLTVTLAVTEVTAFKHECIPIIALLIPLAIGYGGFQATNVQFGIDQLHDASTPQLKSFVAWYSWTFLASGLVMDYIAKCVQNALVLQLVICCNLTLAVILNLVLNKVLIKEPSTHNPFKLIYKVISYAIKHKRPRQRSAFTYCEDKIPSRIDFGKIKYGGPFTTEQVEDVKTLLRIILLLVFGCAAYAISSQDRSITSTTNIFINDTLKQLVSKCSINFTITGSYFICGTVMIPIHELVVNPVFHRCLPNPKSSHKLIMGAILRIGQLAILLTLVTVSRYNYLSIANGNSTLPCTFQKPDGFLGAYIDDRWAILSEVTYLTSDVMFFVGTLEFFCAQVPYSMKGLVIGTLFAVLGLYLTSFSAIKFIFTKKSVNWGTGVISCGFWYFLMKLILQTIATVLFYMIIKLYKKRKREDVLPNEQIFAERYYSH